MPFAFSTFAIVLRATRGPRPFGSPWILAYPQVEKKGRRPEASRLLHARERVARWLRALPTGSVGSSRLPGEGPAVQEEHDDCHSGSKRTALIGRPSSSPEFRERQQASPLPY